MFISKTFEIKLLQIKNSILHTYLKQLTKLLLVNYIFYIIAL